MYTSPASVRLCADLPACISEVKVNGGKLQLWREVGTSTAAEREDTGWAAGKPVTVPPGPE